MTTDPLSVVPLGDQRVSLDTFGSRARRLNLLQY